MLVCVTDATHLRLNLRLVLEARALGLPMVLVLNMMDVAERQGIAIDREALSRELGMPVLATVGVRGNGAQELVQWLDGANLQQLQRPVVAPDAAARLDASDLEAQNDVIRTHQEVRRILDRAVRVPVVSPVSYTHLTLPTNREV